MAKRYTEDGALVLTFKDQTVSRGQGCWNCVSWENDEKTKAYWNEQRMKDLNYAMSVAVVDPRGEDHPQVVQIRRMVDLVDRTVAKKEVGICLKGKSETHLVFAAYLCDGWTGRQGASLAREGNAPDLLPDELKAKMKEES